MSNLRLMPLSRYPHPAAYLAVVKDLPVRLQLQSFLDMPYPADPLFEPELVGLTYGQVALFRQVELATQYNRDSLEFVLDRTIGKVPQVNKNLNIGMNYQDFLDNIANAEEQSTDGVIDVAVDHSTTDIS